MKPAAAALPPPPAAIRCGWVGLRPLPPPDRWEHRWDPEDVAVVRVGAGPLGAAVARALGALGWRVVTLDPTGAALDAAEPYDVDPEPALREVERHGRIVAFVDVHDAAATGADLLDAPVEEARLLSTFAFASALGPRLAAPGRDRAWFVVVTQLDGALGLAPAGTPREVVTAGVYGLVKTLRHEWPTVTCRAVDLHPDLPAAEAADRVVDELLDADRGLAEVALGPGARRTPAIHEAPGGR